jgi:flagellar protein FliO/FliZ
MLGSLSLGTRERLLLVEVEGRRILLGVTPGEISRLDAAPDGARAADFDAALTRAEDRR